MNKIIRTEISCNAIDEHGNLLELKQISEGKYEAVVIDRELTVHELIRRNKMTGKTLENMKLPAICLRLYDNKEITITERIPYYIDGFTKSGYEQRNVGSYMAEDRFIYYNQGIVFKKEL